MGRKNPPKLPPAVRAECPVCGTVTVEVSCVNLLLRNTGTGNGMVFRCPKCLDMIELESLGKATTCALMAVGVQVVDQTVECLSYPGRPPLTERYVERFVKSIEHISYLAVHARREIARNGREPHDAQ